MLRDDVVIEKLSSISKCLDRIEEVTNSNPETLNDINIQDIFVLNLQRAIQQTIDLAGHIVAARKLGSAKTMSDNFLLLGTSGYLDKKITSALCDMVGFRNIAVHDYKAIKPGILKSILTHHMNDLRIFMQQVTEILEVETL